MSDTVHIVMPLSNDRSNSYCTIVYWEDTDIPEIQCNNTLKKVENLFISAPKFHQMEKSNRKLYTENL